MIILGYDPGVKNQGFSIVKYSSNGIEVFRQETLVAKKESSFFKILDDTYEKVGLLLDIYKVDLVAIEKPVFSTAFGADLNRVLGVFLYAVGELPIHYFSPNEIKRQVTGNGKASKDEVEYFVSKISGCSDFASNHAADATACALCYLSQLGESYGSNVTSA